ncbi:glycosyltransferase family 32 protein [Roseovarius sp. EL26]|uniref:glycosyltransferase family 32 protein n=1 Tax=Roseovarius sp. EL26 TaxID=2126672 RepID=UPI000EA369FB|nr:glycosyltransferase [Roseovarius sp. EL26]
MIIPKIIPPRKAPPGDKATFGIPFIIHQTFMTNDVTENMYNAAMRWVELNPEFEYRFYDNDDCRELIETKFDRDMLAAFDKITHGAFKADFWRYCILYLHGGVYADIDTFTLTPLLDLIQPSDHFVAPREPVLQYGITNSFMCVRPGHPFMKAAFERATRVIHANTGPFDGFMLTGPANLGMAVNSHFGQDEKAVFELGQHSYDSSSPYRLLEMLPPLPDRPRCIMDGETMIMFTEYPEYRDELREFGIQHWLNDPVYNGIIPRLRQSTAGRFLRKYVRKIIPKKI